MKPITEERDWESLEIIYVFKFVADQAQFIVLILQEHRA